jgi:hypothetical protein
MLATRASSDDNRVKLPGLNMTSWEENMGKRIKILGSIATAIALLGASPASATTATHTTFYSDASRQTEVGYLLWTGCDAYDNPTYHLVGTYTYFTIDEPIGYCYYGEMYPL